MGLWALQTGMKRPPPPPRSGFNPEAPRASSPRAPGERPVLPSLGGGQRTTSLGLPATSAPRLLTLGTVRRGVPLPAPPLSSTSPDDWAK